MNDSNPGADTDSGQNACGDIQSAGPERAMSELLVSVNGDVTSEQIAEVLSRGGLKDDSFTTEPATQQCDASTTNTTGGN